MGNKRFTQQEKTNILKKSGCVCAHCGKPLTVRTMTIDHAVPKCKGGPSCFSNLFALCEKCNCSKGAKIVKPSKYYRFAYKWSLQCSYRWFNVVNRRGYI